MALRVPRSYLRPGDVLAVHRGFRIGYKATPFWLLGGAIERVTNGKVSHIAYLAGPAHEVHERFKHIAGSQPRPMDRLYVSKIASAYPEEWIVQEESAAGDHLTTLREFEGPEQDVHVGRNTSISDEQQWALFVAHMNLLGQPYDYLDFGEFALRALIPQARFLFSGEANHLVCSGQEGLASEMVQPPFEYSHGKRYWELTPQDIYASPIMIWDNELIHRHA